jgi:hypothetical protein
LHLITFYPFAVCVDYDQTYSAHKGNEKGETYVAFDRVNRRQLARSIEGEKEDIEKNKPFKAAIIITIADKQKLHPYFLLTCKSIASSKQYFDMLVFHEGNSALNELASASASASKFSSSTTNSCAENVKFIDLSNNGITERIINAVIKLAENKENNMGSESIASAKGEKKNIINKDTRDMLVDYISNVIRHIPKYLVEIKPMLGDIMSDFLIGYTHWTYSDPDILWGRLEDWLEISGEGKIQSDSLNPSIDNKDEIDTEVNHYDVITFSKSMDAARLFLRGEFSLHKNIARLNNLWKEMDCFSLKSFASRLGSVVGDIKISKVDSSFHALVFL